MAVSVSGTTWSSSFETSSTRTHGRISMGLLLYILLASTSFCLHVEGRRQFSMGFVPVPAGNNGSSSFAIPHRKLLISGTLNEEEADRSWGEKRCSKSELVIRQGPTKPLSSGIPTYTVEITNACITKDCHISQIHLKCGWFSSAQLINPHIFKRISFDNCLVNDGKPLSNGETIRFEDANTFPYHLSVFSINC